MSKILIIGNGFDLQHNLKSTFLDFKNFLEKENNELKKHIDNFVLDKQRWSNIEDDLLNHGYDYFINEIDEIIEGNSYSAAEEYDVCEPSTYNNEYYMNSNDIDSQSWVPYKFNELLKEWIKRKNDKKIIKINSINLQSFELIINFNYTNYWEKLYKNKASVYYPHGNIVEGQPKIGYTLHKTTNKNFEGEYSPERIDYKEILNEFNKRDWDFYKNI